MNKTIEALKLAENTLKDIIRVYKFETGTPVTALAAIRESLAEQEKQEPVAYLVTGPYEKREFEDIGSAEAYCRWLNKGYGDAAYSVSPLYAAPVDAKAIRAEALEEAIKIVDNVLGRQNAVSAAIRGLK